MEHDNVNHPKHYMEGFAPVNIECIDITRHMDFCLGNAFKYVWRAGKKGGKKKALEDLDKALWYLDLCSKSVKWGPREATAEGAKAVFRLIKYPEDNGREDCRYRALWSMIDDVSIDTTTTLMEIEELKSYFKEERIV